MNYCTESFRIRCWAYSAPTFFYAKRPELRDLIEIVANLRRSSVHRIPTWKHWPCCQSPSRPRMYLARHLCSAKLVADSQGHRAELGTRTLRIARIARGKPPRSELPWLLWSEPPAEAQKTR